MQLKVFEYGSTDNPSLVFLHGASVSSWMWQRQLDVLAKQYHCVTIDLPGSGDSCLVPWHSMAATAENVGNIIHARCRQSQAHVVGFSMGAYIGLHLLKSRPEVLQSLILSGVTTRPFPRPWITRVMLAIVCQTLRWDWVIRWQSNAMNLPAEFNEHYHKDMKRMSPSMLRRVFDEVLDYELPRGLEGKERGLLALAGDREQPMVRDGLADIAERTKGICANIDNAGHTWIVDQPDLFNKIVSKWVEERELPSHVICLN